MNDSFRKIVVLFKKYFDLRTDKESEEATIAEITKGVNFRGANLWILIFAIFLASLGLNVNSTAVIIGAMLISPLMGPIVGMGLAVGVRDFELLKRSFRNYLVATIISVLTATVYFFVSPLSEAQSELLARTSPTLYDVFIALFGGAAGIMALCTKGKGNVIPGVAIATALMPPLCTAGFGLATGNISYFLGAFYLFFINTVFIALATYIGVRSLHFHYKQLLNKEQQKTVRKYIFGIVIVTMIPAFFMTLNIIQKSIFENNVKNFVNKEVKQAGTQIISFDTNKSDSTLRVVAVGKEIADSSIFKAPKRMHFYNLKDYHLQIIQGSNSSEISLLKDEIANKNGAIYSNQLQETQENLLVMQEQIREYKKYENISKELKDEIKALFPKVEFIALASASEIYVNKDSVDKSSIAIVSFENNNKPTAEESKKLSQWLKTRTKTKDLKIIIR